MAARVVAYRGADVWRQLRRIEQQPQGRVHVQLGERLERLVEARDVPRVVLAVMQSERALVDVRLEGRVVVRQRGKRVLHHLIDGSSLAADGHREVQRLFTELRRDEGE